MRSCATTILGIVLPWGENGGGDRTCGSRFSYIDLEKRVRSDQALSADRSGVDPAGAADARLAAALDPFGMAIGRYARPRPVVSLVCRARHRKRWPWESGQRDKWIFCLTAARVAADQERA
jgi:hypothetical protein